MKTWVFLDFQLFQAYLEKDNLPNGPETLQTYLREIGTSAISFQKPSEDSSFIEVPMGSCIKLRTEAEYTLQKKSIQPQQDKSRRTSSCNIV